MVLDLQMLNTDAVLNNFFDIGSARFIPGQSLTLNMRLLQPEKKGLRYVPDAAATFAMTFKLSDGTTLNKVPTFLDAGDRSLLTVSLNDVETELLIGQNLSVEVTEPSGVCVAVLQMALKSVKTEGC